MKHIYIVEDKPIIGQILKQTIEESGASVRLFPTGTEFLMAIGSAEIKPDLVMMDINLPDISGIELTGMVKEKYPATEVIMQTINDDSNNIIQAIEAGANGYLLKDAPAEEVLAAIRIVTEGGSFLTGRVARKILKKFQKPAVTVSGAQRFNLTEREEAILKELIKGQTDKEIAATCGISIHGVNKHLRNIYGKMQVNSRQEAIYKAFTTAWE